MDYCKGADCGRTDFFQDSRAFGIPQAGQILDYCKEKMRNAIGGVKDSCWVRGYGQGEADCNGEVRMTARVW